MPRETHEEKWRAFHARNPQVYELLRAKALYAVRRGHKRLGLRTIWEALRWDLTVQVDSADDFKLNDHYTPFYARELMAREPELAGVFEVRGDAAANDDQAEGGRAAEQREIWEVA